MLISNPFIMLEYRNLLQNGWVASVHKSHQCVQYFRRIFQLDVIKLVR